MDTVTEMPKMDEPHMGMNMKNDTGGGMMMMMMQMYFVVSSEVTILFKQWHTTNAGEMIGSCIALFAIGVLYEGLKVWRQKMLLKPFQMEIPIEQSQESCDTQTTLFKKNQQTLTWSRFCPKHLIQTVLHMVQVFIGYVLMLAFMTYNVWICIAVILGAGFGYFLFGAQPVFLPSDHCN